MNDYVEIRKAIAIILNRLWLLILIALIAATIGYEVSRRQTPVYEAAATIMIGQFLQATELNKVDLLTSDVLAQTYADMALRQPVLQGVINTLNLGGSWRWLKQHLRITRIEGTQLIQITAEAGSPEQASAIADEVAHHLILLSPTAMQNQKKAESLEFMNQRLANLKTKIELGQANLQTLEKGLSESKSAKEIQELQSAIHSLEGLINDWENNYMQMVMYMESESLSNSLTVIEPAQADTQPVRPQIYLNTILAGALGLLVGLGLVLFLGFRNDTLKSADELTLALGITTLAVVEKIAGRRNESKLLSVQNAASPALEAYRIMRGNIEFKTADHPVKSIVVTSAVSGEGKSLTAANLGIIMARAGYRTIIVDADLRQPTQHQLFQTANSLGLAEVVCLPDSALAGHLINTKVQNLRLLPSGVPPLNPAELLGSQAMRRVLVSLSQMADIVIYDSPPVLGLTDASILANRADGVVLVVEANQTQLKAAKQVIATLQQANANVIGAILNRGRPGHQQYYNFSRQNSALGAATTARLSRCWQWLPF